MSVLKEDKKVDIFIVGAMKAGTTSFAALLSQHPMIFMSPIKEPHHFVDPLPKAFLETSRFFSLENYFENSYPEPLHNVQVSNEADYKKLFSAASKNQYWAEASTAYLHAPEAAHRIFKYNPNAKIIILTRNPLERAFSHYKMDMGLGRIKDSFSYYMEREIEFYKNGTFPWYSYINMSCYNKPINIYRESFENVLVIALEDLITNTETELAKVSAFLNIASFEYPHLEKINSGSILKIPFLFYYLKRMGVMDVFSKIIPSKIKMLLFKTLSNSTRKLPPLSKELQRELYSIFHHQ